MEVVDEDTQKAQSLFEKGMDQLRDGDYLVSLETFNEIKKILPEHPMGYLFYAANLMWVIFDYHSLYGGEDFLNNINKSIELSQQLVEKYPDDAWSHFYLGGSYGFRGIYETVLGSVLRSFVDGLRGVLSLNKAMEINPGIYDSYYGIGTFHYWRGHYLGRVYGSDKEQGINELHMSMYDGTYTVMESRIGLVGIYLNENRGEDSMELIQEALSTSPNYIRLRWYDALVKESLEDWEGAIEAYEWVDNFTKDSELRGNATSFIIKHGIANSLYEMGKYQEAYDTLEKINLKEKQDKNREIISDIKEYTKKINTLKKKIKKKL